ncbi:MAG: O-acetyltransferase OatA [Bacteroidota bacterium]|jgi:peptidoglycan/LPS O-acetylase OafA/YrhL
MTSKKRLIELDFLRGIAVLLVLCRHHIAPQILYFSGWVGVYLFFVLSGFLVGGLIISEFKQFNKFNARRFFIRRGFKIYPLFALLVLFTCVINKYFPQTLLAQNITAKNILTEIFFVQNYFEPVWINTWSLGLEEQFYLILIVGGVLFSAFSIQLKKHIGLLLLCFSTLIISGFKFVFVLHWNYSEPLYECGFVGQYEAVCIGFLTAFLVENYSEFITIICNQLWIKIIMVVGLIFPFVFEGGYFFMNSFGGTFVNCCFALLIIMLTEKLPFHKSYFIRWYKYPIYFFSFIGINSYAIYLFHPFIKFILYDYFKLIESINLFPIYLLCSIAFGIILTYLIEKPVLEIRNKYFN